MFTGRYYYKIETKGRLAIPVSFREELKSGGVVTWGLDGCLFLFPNSYWQKFSAKLASLSLTNQTARNLTRLLVQSASDLNLDAQGRTLIPDYLRQQANLKKQVVVAGSLNHVEIWDQTLYHAHLESITQSITNCQDLSGLDL
jgi:MraZ protein